MGEPSVDETEYTYYEEKVKSLHSFRGMEESVM